MPEQDLSIPACTCNRCGHKWYVRKPERPGFCPKCKSPYWDSGASEYRQQLNIDLAKVQQIEDKLTSTIQEASRNPKYWFDVVRIGWERMLRTSDFPIRNIEPVLGAGFSVSDWFMNVSKLSENLVIDVQNKIGSLNAKNQNANDASQRAKEVMDWNQVLEKMNPEGIKVLGFLWFADAQTAQLQFTDNQALVQHKAWELLEENLGRSKEELRIQTQLMITNCDEGNVGAISWVEIVRFP
jgi:hypothetical protein